MMQGNPGNDNDTEPRVTEKEDTAALKQAMAEEKEKAENYLANWQRSQADFINYKRRCEQEKEEIGKFASMAVILSLLPVLDDLERAFTAVPPELDKLNWVEGVRLIYRKLQANLELQGVSAIHALGEPFDPRLHEAVRQDKGRDGIVIGEIYKGYKFRDRVIRPSQVIVGNGQPADTAKTGQ